MAMSLSIEDPSVDGARSGDPTAWADLYERFHPVLVRYFEVVAPDSDAEAVWERAAYALAGQPVGIRPLVWLLRVARELRVGDADPTNAADDTVRAIRTLPPLQMEIITLRVVGRLSDGDVAAIVGWPESRVATAAHNALRELSREADAA